MWVSLNDNYLQATISIAEVQTLSTAAHEYKNAH